MNNLNKKTGELAITATGTIMFTGIVLLAPLLQTANYQQLLGSGLATALSSFGLYKLITYFILLSFRKIQRFRKLLLKDAFLEGTWVGHYQRGGHDRFTIENITQEEGELIISGIEVDENGKTRADWSSETAFIDLKKQRLIYAYSCDVYSTNHQQNGIGAFKILKSAQGKSPDILDGYAVDMVDGTKDPNREHKISDIIVSLEESLKRAKKIFKSHIK